MFLFQPFICRAAIIFVDLKADEIKPALTIASDQGTSASGVCVQYLHTFSGEEGKNPRIQLHGLLCRVNCPVVQQFNAIADKNESITQWQTMDGRTCKGPNIMPKFKNNPGQIWRGMPSHGMDTAAILKNIGYSENDIQELVSKGLAKVED